MLRAFRTMASAPEEMSCSWETRRHAVRGSVGSSSPLKVLCPEADEQSLTETGRIEWSKRSRDMPERAAATYAAEQDLGTLNA